MSDPVVEGPNKRLRSALFPLLGVYDGERLNGPLNHILARMLTIPRMIWDYMENYPNENELPIYTDPLLLQFDKDELEDFYCLFFSDASSVLNDDVELVERFRLLGEIGEAVAGVERVYPAVGSTQAYEIFGIFHLFPSNQTVDITATSPGVILPTEADPLRYKDSVTELRKNLLRPTYFEMLRHSIDIGENRRRRYSASRKGTAQNLRKYPQLLGAAKQILSEYLVFGDRFEIRLGEQLPEMKLATLIGDAGVVYSVRDAEQKNKIAHNVTVMNPEEARKHRELFEEQWSNGKPIQDTEIVDELAREVE